MTARILDGRPVAERIIESVKARADRLRARGISPSAAVLVSQGDGPGFVYAQSIKRRGASAGIEVEIIGLDFSSGAEAPLATLRAVAAKPTVHAILLQRPLPAHVDARPFIDAIPANKDADAAHPHALGLLTAGQAVFVPATAAAVMELLSSAGTKLQGERAVVVGRSLVVGRPVAMLLIAAHATVTLCHSYTRDLTDVTRRADILVAAMGKPKFITADMVKPGATVVDVGTNVVAGAVVGDVDPGVAEVAGALSPVPGGVGPVTTAVFLRNVVEAAERLAG